MTPPTRRDRSRGTSQVPLRGAGALPFLPVGFKVGVLHPKEAQSERGVTRGWRGFGARHMHRGGYLSGCLTKRAASFMLGQCLGGSVWGWSCCQGGAGVPRAAQEGWQQSGSSLIPHHRQSRNLSEIRHDGGGGHMKFRGSHPKKTLQCLPAVWGCRNPPSVSIPSTPAEFGGVTPFCNRTLIPLLPRKHKGNPQNN